MGSPPNIGGERVWLQGYKYGSYLLTEVSLIYYSIEVYTTTKGHIGQGVSNKLFDDGLVSMKFNLPVI